MGRSLTFKLIVAFLLVSLVGTSVAAIYVAYITTDRFSRYVAEQSRLRTAERWADYYRIRGSWEGVREAMPMADPAVPGAMPMAGMPMGSVALVDAQGHVIVAGAGFMMHQTVPMHILRTATPIMVDGQVVGYMVQAAVRPRPDVPRLNFLIGFYRVLAVGSLVATAAALALGVLLARSLTRPLRELTAATQAVAKGELAQQIPVRSNDELGQLAASFNRMSAELVRAQEARRQMTADIAHELRTPLSLILGHAEALSDGVLPPTPQTFAIIYDEAQRLTRLVDDLRTLSLSEAGELALQIAPLRPEEIIERAAAAHRPQAAARNVEIVTYVAPDLPEVEGDFDRVAQVLDNLLANALRFSPEGSTLELRAESLGQAVRFSVRDEGPGIAPEDQQRVFDRFYRTDRSRSRDLGGSGLGLAIARQLILLQGGEIGVQSTLGEGATFWFTLPVSGAKEKSRNA